MANFEGAFVNSQYETGRVVVDMRNKIFMLNKSATPFLTFGEKLEGDPTNNMEYWLFEDDFLSWTDTAKSAAAADATTVYVTNPTRYAVDMIVWNQTTAERMLVTSVVSASDYILVTRAFGTTTSATVLASDSLVILGPAANEKATSQNGLMTTKTSVINYAQEFRWPYEMSERAANTSTRTGSAWDLEDLKAGEEHKLQMERSLLFGEKKKAIASTLERYATAGLKSYIASANAYSVGGTLSEFDFDDWARSIFRAGTGEARSDTKILLANDRLLGTMNRFVKNRLQLNQMDSKKYGVNIVDYVTPFGTIKLTRHRLLDTAYANTGYGLLFDPANVRLRYFMGPVLDGHTKLHKDIQANDATTKKNEYRTTVGLEVKHASTHGEISGVTG